MKRSSFCSACARTSRSSPPSATAPAAARGRAEHRPDVVLMDYRLPGLDGVQATAAVREACPDARVVCLTASANAREIEALFEAGAAAVSTKDQELEEIVDAIKRAAGRAAAGDVNLTADNTAIVLDSTADFPDARERFRTGASSRSTSTSGPRASVTAST